MDVIHNDHHKPSLVRRSILILPVNRPQFVEKSWQRGADAVQLDLEDSVLETEKAAARKMIKAALTLAGQGGADVLVRVNHDQRHLDEDLEASIYPGLHALTLPKIETAEQVQEIEKKIASLEKTRGLAAGSIKLSLLIESAKGFLYINEIVSASTRIETITLGTEDFILDLDMQLEDGSELLFPKLQTIISAKSAGIQPIGLIGSMANYKDLSGLDEQARQSYRYGFRGSSCIHPSQVKVLNRAFSPTVEEAEQARRIIEVWEKAQEAGHGSASLDGQMIDLPVAIRSYKVLERCKAIEGIEQRKRRALEKLGFSG